MSKLVTLTIAGGAYVLGAKAGTERYEQITAKAQKLWQNPRVQDTTEKASGLVKRKAAEATSDDHDHVDTGVGRSTSDTGSGARPASNSDGTLTDPISSTSDESKGKETRP